MLNISDDKTAYGQLQAIVKLLEKDAADARHQRDRQTTRSQHWARYDGEMGAYNQTIALIMTTDVWRVGAQQEQKDRTPRHWHMKEGTQQKETLTTDPKLVHDWLTARDYTGGSATAFLHGVSVEPCDQYECMTRGSWLAQSVPETT